MDRDNIYTDIKFIKLMDYTARYPEKSIGYFCLARLCMDSGRYDAAGDYLKKALSGSRRPAPVIIAAIENCVKQGKFLKAANYYEKHRHILESKNISRQRTARAVTSIFESERKILNRKTGIVPLQLLQPVSSLFGKKEDNLVTILLLAMHKAVNKDMGERALLLYNKILNMNGVSDGFRWHLLKLLGRRAPSLFASRSTASLFTCIPKGCSTQYANIIFDTALESDNRARIAQILECLGRQNLPVSPSTMWKYVVWCRNESILDDYVREYCRRLVKAGWVDRILLGTLADLRDKKGISLSSEENRYLELFG
jgi:tetratricopeptide (TPR) repeat protein